MLEKLAVFLYAPSSNKLKIEKLLPDLSQVRSIGNLTVSASPSIFTAGFGDTTIPSSLSNPPMQRKGNFDRTIPSSLSYPPMQCKGNLRSTPCTIGTIRIVTMSNLAIFIPVFTATSSSFIGHNRLCRIPDRPYCSHLEATKPPATTISSSTHELPAL